MEQEAKGNKASVTTSSGCQRQFEEPYAGKPQVRFRGGAAAAMPTAYSTIFKGGEVPDGGRAFFDKSMTVGFCR